MEEENHLSQLASDAVLDAPQDSVNCCSSFWIVAAPGISLVSSRLHVGSINSEK